MYKHSAIGPGTDLTCTRRGSKDRSSKNPEYTLTRAEKIYIVVLVVSAVFAFTLIGLNVVVIVNATKIGDSVDTVINAQTAFNKLGMGLTTSAGEEDKAEATSLIVVESLTIVLNIPLFIALFYCLVYLIHTGQDITCWKVILPFIAIGCFQVSLLVATAIYVHKMRPSESNEMNVIALRKSLHDYYKDDSFPSPGNANSDTWNEIFIDYQCCAALAVMSTTNDFDNSSWCTTSGSCQQTNSQIPKACCKGVDKTSYVSAPSACHEYVTSGTYNEKGCGVVWLIVVENLKDDENNTYSFGIAAAVLLALSSVLFQYLAYVLRDMVIINYIINKVKPDKKHMVKTPERKTKPDIKKVNKPEEGRREKEENTAVNHKSERKTKSGKGKKKVNKPEEEDENTTVEYKPEVQTEPGKEHKKERNQKRGEKRIEQEKITMEFSRNENNEYKPRKVQITRTRTWENFPVEQNENEN